MNTVEEIPDLSACADLVEFAKAIILPEVYAKLHADNTEWAKDKEPDYIALYFANLAVNYAGYDARERDAYSSFADDAIGRFELNLDLARHFFRLAPQHIARCTLRNGDYLLSADAEGDHSMFSSPWSSWHSTPESYAFTMMLYDFHNDECSFSLGEADHDIPDAEDLVAALQGVRPLMGETAWRKALESKGGDDHEGDFVAYKSLSDGKSTHVVLPCVQELLAA